MKQFIMKNNFSAGELAPTLYTRTDIQQYANGAKTLTNVIPLVEGGVRKRPGTFFIKEQPNSTRIIPFIVNSNNAYMLILKPFSIDVFDPRLKTLVTTLATPYTAEQIPDVQFVQYRFDLFLTHNSVPVQRLRCGENFTTWQLNEFVYTYAPTDSENARYPFRKGTASGKDLGAFVTFTLDAVTEWTETQAYLAKDVVSYQKLLYQASVDNTGKIPGTTVDWVLTNSNDSAVFTASDVGNYLDVNGGLIKITKYNNVNSVSGEIVKVLESNIKAIERSWSVIPPAFNALNGYPKCCTYFKQRLVFANNKKAPNKIWFSAVGDNGNFLETTDDSDAFSIVSASGLANSILFLEAQRGVVCLTSGGEFMVDSDGALTPTSVNINEHSAYGTYPVTRPERVGNELLFVQRGGERVRALTYRYEVDGLVSPEISSLASHIGELHQGISQISYQQEPENLVWCVLGDGKVASITFNRDQEVVAWAQHDFSGTVLSISSMPTQLGADKTFILINRNGVICLEELSFDALVDSQRIVGSGVPAYLTNISAYQREGNAVYQTDINDGLHFGQNINCVIELFPPELSQTPLSSLLHKAKVDRTAFFFNKTIAPELNGQLLELFKYDANTFGPKPPYTGYYLTEGGSWDDLHETPLVISHNKPLPFHLQAITMQMSINEK